MRFVETSLSGAIIIEVEPITDSRGFFARVWCQDVLQETGLNTNILQCNIAFNSVKGTFRGLHFQYAPHSEVKLVRCTKGAIYDIAVDIRPSSPTFKRWIGVELTDTNHKSLYIPEGFAHGYQTISDESEVFYQVSHRYTPSAEGGIRWDDPSLGITLPLPVSAISPKDRQLPLIDTLQLD